MKIYSAAVLATVAASVTGGAAYPLTAMPAVGDVLVEAAIPYGGQCNGGEGKCRMGDECDHGYWSGKCGSGNPYRCCKPAEEGASCHNGAGECRALSACSNGHWSGKCGPGPRYCCKPAAGAADAEETSEDAAEEADAPVAPVEHETVTGDVPVSSRGYGKVCGDNLGICRISNECTNGKTSGLCGNNPFVCCHHGHERPAGSGFGPAPNKSKWRPNEINFQGQRLCFPIRRGGLRTSGGEPKGIRWDHFGSARSKGRRCHSGVDIYTKSPGVLVSVADGKVIKMNKFLNCSSGWDGPGWSILMLVYHPSLGITINYGEIDESKAAVKVGDQVKKGQTLGKASVCSMLHFEVYRGEQLNVKWYPGRSITRVGQCANEDRYWRTKPSRTLEPRHLLEYLTGPNGGWCDDLGNPEE